MPSDRTAADSRKVVCPWISVWVRSPFGCGRQGYVQECLGGPPGIGERLRVVAGGCQGVGALPFAMIGSAELLEALPRHDTAHAALLADILDVVHGSSPAAKDRLLGRAARAENAAAGGRPHALAR